MKKQIWLSRALLMIVSCYTAIISAQTKPTVMILGDSLSAAYNIPFESGWVSLMEQKLSESHPNYKVMNASISGETTGNALTRLPGLLDRHQPAILVIELGGNDGLRGFKLPHIRNNLEQMIQLAQESGSHVVLTGIHIPPNYGPAYTQVFYKAYLDLSTQYSTGFVPFILEGIGDNPELMQGDGIHPTEAAQPNVLANMWPHIANAIEVVESPQDNAEATQ